MHIIQFTNHNHKEYRGRGLTGRKHKVRTAFRAMVQLCFEPLYHEFQHVIPGWS
jgi:hypothetical protein